MAEDAKSDGGCIRTLAGHKDSVLGIALLPKGFVVSGSADGTCKVYDPAKVEALTTLEGHQERVYSVAVFPDGRVARRRVLPTARAEVDYDGAAPTRAEGRAPRHRKRAACGGGRRD